ncbi:HEAT repeat domain-containing protein [Sphingobacterium sp.]|uniref:HEAT repeat domain-containing protein n=1 Tax=Sphingobacterium sp. TaxID=341027 RepID=UPI00289F9613|nr:HEAT repeat domain-containing protein [Sphingobacterium sp.]
MYYDYYLYYLSYLSSLYNGYPLIVQLTVVMVIVLGAIILLGILRLLFLGYKINREERRKKSIASIFEERLKFIIGSKANYESEEIHELLQDDVSKAPRWKAIAITDVVLTVKSQLSKNRTFNQINYKNCLEALKLSGFWEKRIRVSGIDERRGALQVVGDMDNGVNSGVLSKSTFHKDKHLRKTARDLYTSQENFSPFRFMEENFDEEFTHLDKLRLHATLIKRSTSGKLPNLMRWATNSRNPNYIIFVLREIGFFKQHDASGALVSLLEKHENREVRAQVVLTLGDLDYDQCIKVLVKRFELETALVREAILKTLGKLKSQEALKFLVDTYRSATDVNTKLIIARSIKGHATEGEMILHQLMLEANQKVELNENVLLEQVFSEKLMVSI